MLREVLASVGVVMVFLPGSMALSLLPVEGTLNYEPQGHAQGQVLFEQAFALHVAATAADPPDHVRLTLAALDAQATHVRYTRDSLIGQQGSLPEPLGGTSHAAWTETYNKPTLELLRATPAWNLVVFTTPFARATLTTPQGSYAFTNAPPGQSLVSKEAPHDPAMAAVLDASSTTHADQLELQLGTAPVVVQGDFYVLLYGATMRLESPPTVKEIQTGRYLLQEPGPGGVPMEREVNATVLLEVRQGTLHLHDASPVTVYATSFRVQGQLLLPRAWGTLAWEGVAQPLQEERLTLEGDLRAASRGALRPTETGTLVGPLAIQGLAYGLPPQDGKRETWGWAAAFATGLGALAFRYRSGLGRVAAGVGLFSMVRRDEALDQVSRSLIFEHVRQNPGTTLSLLQRELGLGWGTTGYHVAVLERLSFLVTKRVGGRRLLFVNGASRLTDPHVWHALQNPSVRILVEQVLRRGESVTIPQAASLLGCSSQYAGRLLGGLRELGLLTVREEASRRRPRFYPTSRLSELDERARHAASVPASSTGQPTEKLTLPLGNPKISA